MCPSIHLPSLRKQRDEVPPERPVSVTRVVVPNIHKAFLLGTAPPPPLLFPIFHGGVLISSLCQKYVGQPLCREITVFVISFSSFPRSVIGFEQEAKGHIESFVRALRSPRRTGSLRTASRSYFCHHLSRSTFFLFFIIPLTNALADSPNSAGVFLPLGFWSNRARLLRSH